MNDLYQHRGQLSNFLKHEKFTVFGTHTTEKELSIAGARRLMDNFFRAFDGKLYIFWVVEPFSQRKGYHIHSLIKSTHPVLGTEIFEPKNYWNYWTRDKKFGRSLFQKIEKENFVTLYVSKYVTKKLSDYDYYTPSTPPPARPVIEPYEQPLTRLPDKPEPLQLNFTNPKHRRK